MVSVTKGSQECVRRECPVERVFDYENHQAIVIHGHDRIAGDLRNIDRAMAEYDRWVDMLHARDDARSI